MNRALSLAWAIAMPLWCGVLGGLAQADTGDNPYQAIVERNVFGLKPLPKPEELAPPPPAAPPSKITLQGIMVLDGQRQVLLKLTEPPTPGQQPKERALIMHEGERQGVLEVVRIDPEAREVEFRDSGNPVTLKLVDFIAKNTGPVPGAPGATPAARPTTPPVLGRPTTVLPGTPAQPVASPTASTVSPGMGAATPTLPSLPSREVRTPFPSAPGTLMVGQNTTPTAAPGIANPTQPQPPQVHLTPEEQMVLMEIERERTKAAVAAGQLPPLPPTPLTPPESLPPMAPPALPPMPGK